LELRLQQFQYLGSPSLGGARLSVPVR
jgi:hypothetical protein